MFGRKHQGRRSSHPLFVLFRLILSLTMFAVLLIGAYSAYKHFSGLDPLKLDPQSVFKQVLGAKTSQQLVTVLSAFKIDPKILGQTTQKAAIPLDSLTKLSVPTQAKYAFRFLLVADSHNDNVNLKKAVASAKQQYPDLSFIIGLGDYTDVGTIDELNNAKKELDSSGLRYFVIPGDHDLWDSRDKQKDPLENFREVFGPSYQSFSFKNFYFLLLNNSDNYIGISKEQQGWINSELEKGKTAGNKGIFVFVHEPLYHPSSDHYMGSVEKDLKTQAQSLILQLKNVGVKKVFAGDIHYFSEYEEPATKLPMMTVGAIVTDRNPQLPRYAVVSVFEDGLTQVEDMEIK